MVSSDKTNRNNIKGYLAISLIAIFSLFLFSEVSKAANSELEQLIEGAKKEKDVNFYHSGGIEDGNAVVQRFEKKYPFLKVNFYRTGGEKFLIKVMTEIQAKRYVADVILALGSSMHIFRKAGILEKYVSTEDRFFPNEFKDYGYWVTNYVGVYVNSYNTKLVPKELLPKTYEDILSPRWNGKMMMDPTKVDWFVGMLQIMGKEKGLNWMEALSKKNISQRIGHTLICQLVASGEAEISINQTTTSVDTLAGKGAHLDWIALGPVPGITMGSGLAAHAPHPNAARLLNNFLLSEEGQNIWTRFQRMSIRSDIPQSEKFKRLKIVPVDPAILDNIKEYTQKLRSIFGRYER